MIEITVTDRQPARAQDIANAVREPLIIEILKQVELSISFHGES